MTMKVELIDELLKGCKTQEGVFGEEGVFKQLVKAISGRALQAELTKNMTLRVKIAGIHVTEQALKQ